MVNVQKAIVTLYAVFAAAKLWASTRLDALKAWLSLGKSATNDQVIDAVANKAKNAVDSKIDQAAETVKSVIDAAQTASVVESFSEVIVKQPDAAANADASK